MFLLNIQILIFRILMFADSHISSLGYLWRVRSLIKRTELDDTKTYYHY